MRWGGSMPLKTVLEQHLLRFQDSRGGGFFGSESARDAGTGVIDFDSITLACAALCSAGNTEAAEKCGRFLVELVRSQPEPDRQFFFMWDTGKGLIDDGDSPPGPNRVLEWKKPGQYLYKIGLLVLALTLLHRLHGNASHLDMAREFYRRAVSLSPDLWTNTLAHKMIWAAHALFCVTGDNEYAEHTCRMADHLVTLQQPDGGFHYPEFWPPYSEVAPEQKLNIGTQFASWIAMASGRR